jgi:hypothetical protein
MQRRVFLSITGAFALAGCSGFRDSRINPRNWFGRSTARPRQAAATSGESGNPLIPEEEGGIFRRRNRAEDYQGSPVDQITALDVERTSDGAIIRATGRTARQGAFDVRLVPDQPMDSPVSGVLSYELQAVQPADAPQGPARARQIQAGVFVSNQTLEPVTELRVRGLRNERVSRR